MYRMYIKPSEASTQPTRSQSYFFSDLPDDIETVIESRTRNQLRQRNQFFDNPSSPLLASNNLNTLQSEQFFDIVKIFPLGNFTLKAEFQMS